MLGGTSDDGRAERSGGAVRITQDAIRRERLEAATEELVGIDPPHQAPLVPLDFDQLRMAVEQHRGFRHVRMNGVGILPQPVLGGGIVHDPHHVEQAPAPAE